MLKRLKNQSGVALMIVMAAITLLTSIAVEFAYNTNVNYNLALNEKERLQAYFLAESAIKLMELELKLEKQLSITLVEEKELEPQNLQVKKETYTIGDMVNVKK